MNGFAARKLGEVLAFAQVGIETYAKGKVAIATAAGTDALTALLESTKGIADRITDIAARSGMTEAVMEKAGSTAGKLRSMRELYLKEEGWRDPAEMCEWLGFFEGSAVVHFAVVQGLADELGATEMRKIGEEGAKSHHEFFHALTEAAARIAKQKGGD